MGMFDSVSSAVTSAEGVANKANSPLDTANQLLGGGPAAGAPAGSTDATVDYKHGRDIDEDVKEKTAAYAHNLENALNSIYHIEFIHFDYVHISITDYFPHDDYSDSETNDEVEDGDRPRAIQFRSGLEREAVLLSEFMKATQRALVERESTGSVNVAAAVNTLGNLFGSSTAASKTKAADLDGHIGKVVAAVKPALDDLITYTNTHQAGMDLHQARANYRALLQKIADEKPDPDPTGGLMNKIPGVSGVAGSFGKIISFTQGVSAKAQDVKAKFFVLAALQQEPQIEIACNQMTLKAIAELANPFLPVWYLNRPPASADLWQQGPDDPLNSLQGNMFAPVRNYAQPAVDDKRRDLKDEANKVKSFFEHAPDDPPPGKQPLGVAFKNPPEPDGEQSLVPMQMGNVACLAFSKALGLTPPLGFPETVVTAIVAIVLEFTEAAYQSILVRDVGTPITQDALLQSARTDLQIGKRLENLAVSKLTFIREAKKRETPKIPGMTGYHVRPGDLLDKEVGNLDDLVAEKIQPLLDPILTYAMKSLADELEKARLANVANHCNTMEWYLGRLPSVQVTLFCNLFFPFWTALMNAVSGLLDGATAGVLRSIIGAAASAQQEVAKAQAIAAAAHQTAEDAKAKLGAMDQAITNTQRDLNQQTPFQELPGKIGAAGNRLGSAMGAQAAPSDPDDSPAAQAAAGPPASNPVAGRSETGQGQKISRDEYKTVKALHQWLDAVKPGDVKQDDPAAGTSNAPASIPV